MDKNIIWAYTYFLKWKYKIVIDYKEKCVLFYTPKKRKVNFDNLHGGYYIYNLMDLAMKK